MGTTKKIELLFRNKSLRGELLKQKAPARTVTWSELTEK